MNIQRIFLTIITTLFLLFFVVSITYFQKDEKIEKIDIGDNYIGYNEIVSSGGVVALKSIPNGGLSENINYVDNVNYVDRVYFSGNNYSKYVNDRVVNFTLGEGLYLFDLYDLSYNYSIKNEYFSINPKSPGKFFVDNRNRLDIKIFSFDSIIDINLIHGKETMTNLVIYPHMFYSINSLRNKALKNSDILRIDSISKIFYINESFLNNDKLLNNDFFSKLYDKPDDKALKFFNDFFYLSYSKNEFDKYNEGIFTQYKYKDLLGFAYLERYMLFFLNDKKRKSYHKKLVLLSLNDFFSSKISEQELKTFKKSIITNLTALKNLDYKDYLEFKNIILLYYKNLLKINSIDYIDNALVLSDIIVSMDNTKTRYELSKSSFYLNKIYSLIDNKTNTNNYLQENLITFLNHFMEENKIVIKDGKFLANKNKDTISKLDYLTFFMKNILIYDISFSDKKNFDNLMNIISVYLSMNKNIIDFHMQDDKVKNGRFETLIIEYSGIVENLLDEIRNSFFDKELNDRGLLALNIENAISNKQVIKLNQVVNTFFNFYNVNKGYISKKNESYNSDYKEYINKYKDYHFALSNYSDYLIKYDKVKNDLLKYESIYEKDKKITLSIDELISFLKQFEGVNYTSVKYNEVEKSYYKLDNVYINGEKFAFNLYPNEFNRIDNIIRNGKKLTASYELDSLRDELAELYESASEEEKDKYDFKKFFLNTFFKKDEEGGKVFVEDVEEVVEDKAVTYFKRDKLFGPRGDFNALVGILDIKYADVEVTLNEENKYYIYIKNAILRTRIEMNGEGEAILANFKSEYVFSEKEHNFKNIKLIFYDPDDKSEGEKAKLFDGKEFSIEASINILEFKDEITKEITNIFQNN